MLQITEFFVCPTLSKICFRKNFPLILTVFISIENIVIVSANVQQPTEAPFLTACKQEINQPSLTEILVCLKMNSTSFYSAACKCKCLVYLSPGLGMVRSLSLCVMFWVIFVL